MSSCKPPETKYRPVLTATQISHLLSLCKSQSPITDIDISIIAVLAPFQAKIQNAGISAAYTTNPRPSLEESLGMSENPLDLFPSHITKEEYWKRCYIKLIEQGARNLSLTEIQAANEWRYLNDLMTPEEEAEHEENNSHTSTTNPGESNNG